MRSRSSSSSSASRGESRKISGSMRSSESVERIVVVDVDDELQPEAARPLVQRLEMLLVVVVLDDDQARVGSGLVRGFQRRVHAEQDRQPARIPHPGAIARTARALGALFLGRSRGLGVADEGDDRDPVSLGDRLAEAAAAGHWPDATQVPIGCQTVFSSRKAAISQGLCPVGGAVDDALDVLGGELLELGREPVGARHVDRVDVHVRGEPGRELGALPGEDVDDAARDVGGGEHLAELDRGERVRLGGDDHRGVAADDRGREPRDEPVQRRLVGREDPDDAGRLRDREVEVRAGDGVRPAEHLGELVGPARVPDEAIDRNGRPPPRPSRARRGRRGAPRASRRSGRGPGRGCTRSRRPSRAGLRGPP